MGLIHTHGRIVIKVDMESKNSHTFSDGTTIRLERDWDNFNNREVKPVNATVVSSEYIPTGAEILIHHNCTHPTNEIFNYKSGAANIKYFSIPETDCYAWRNEHGELMPTKNFEFGLRVFEPYQGLIQDIEPKKLKDILYITTGNLSGLVVRTVKAADYEIIFQDVDGREGRLIRLRHSEDENFDREEILAIDYGLTEKVKNNLLFLGLSTTDAKPLIHHEIKSNATQ